MVFEKNNVPLSQTLPKQRKSTLCYNYVTMNLPTYDVKLKSEAPYTFDFISEGKNGNIQKVIMFQETGIEGVFNLGFGDKDPEDI